jgi:hypothetical protein
MFGYVWRDLVRNPRRTLAALVGITSASACSPGLLFFSDGSRATLTKRAIAPLALDMQAVLTAPMAGPCDWTSGSTPPGRSGPAGRRGSRSPS